MEERIQHAMNFKKCTRLFIGVAVLLLGMTMADTTALSVGESSRTYYLENPTETQKFERLLSVTLHADGAAALATPPISSYLLPPCIFSIADGELLIHAVIETQAEEEFYGVKQGEVIARFFVVGEDTLVFAASAVPVFAEPDARYVCARDVSRDETDRPPAP